MARRAGGDQVIVRTAPVILPEPDAMRAMERLEAQLRRAADDLAASLATMREAATLPLVEIPGPDRPRCNRWMPIAKEPCRRQPGHRDSCRSRAAMESDTYRQRVQRTPGDYPGDGDVSHVPAMRPVGERP